MLQFNQDDATQLRNSIASFQTTYTGEWSDFIQKFQHLQYLWNDVHRVEFDQEFYDLLDRHNQINLALDQHPQELDRVTSLIVKMNEQLIYLVEQSAAQFPSNSNTNPVNSAQQSNQQYSEHNSSAEKKDFESTIQRFPKLYNHSIDSFQSIAKTGAKGLNIALTCFAMANAIYNTQVVKTFQAIGIPLNTNTSLYEEIDKQLNEVGVDDFWKRREQKEQDEKTRKASKRQDDTSGPGPDPDPDPA